MLALLRRIERDTVRLAAIASTPGARYPRDYYRPLALLQMWNRCGWDLFPTGSVRRP
jgi:hypothetical protein